MAKLLQSFARDFVSLACLTEIFFTELDFIDFVRAIQERGFEVEIWGWMVKDLSELADTGASFGLMTGYIKGDLIDDESNARLIDTAAQSIKASKNINCPG